MIDHMFLQDLKEALKREAHDYRVVFRVMNPQDDSVIYEVDDTVVGFEQIPTWLLDLGQELQELDVEYWEDTQ